MSLSFENDKETTNINQLLSENEIKVSVIIPAYQCEKYLRKCIQSVLDQTVNEIEILIVNDASSDRTQEIIESYSANEKILSLKNEFNLGIVRSREKGINAACGKYILFLDSDDWIAPETVEKLYKLAESKNADLTFYNYFKVINGINYPVSCFDTSFELFQEDIIGQSLTSLQHWALWRKLIKRDYLKKINYEEIYSINYWEDYVASIVLALYNPKIAYLEEHLYYWNINHESTSATVKDRYSSDVIDGFKFICNRFKKEGIYAQYQEILAECLRGVTLYTQGLNNKCALELRNYCKQYFQEEGSNLDCKDRKISIIIPVYQGERYIEACLLSILDSTFTDFEIIIIDDGSTDGTRDILNRYQTKFDRIKVILKEDNEGTVRAREVGIKHAQGEYIYMIDADDLIHPEALETLYQEAIWSKADIVLFNYIQVHGGVGYQRNISHPVYNQMSRDLIRDSLIGDAYPPQLWLKFIKTEFLRRVNFKDLPSICREEDFLISLMMVLNNPKILYIDDYLYIQRVNEYSVTHNFNAQFWVDGIEERAYVFKKFRELGIAEKYKKELEYHLEVGVAGYREAIKKALR